jgi:replicative DNA helicase
VNEVSELSRSLKLASMEFGCPILVISQLSRACDVRPGDHRPILSDLRDSGSIEQDGDLIAFVYREERYKPDRPELRGRAELILAKQRNGPEGTIKLEFRHGPTKFANPTHDCSDMEEAS